LLKPQFEPIADMITNVASGHSGWFGSTEGALLRESVAQIKVQLIRPNRASVRITQSTTASKRSSNRRLNGAFAGYNRSGLNHTRSGARTLEAARRVSPYSAVCSLAHFQAC
jgi:hypothetical protein